MGALAISRILHVAWDMFGKVYPDSLLFTGSVSGLM